MRRLIGRRRMALVSGLAVLSLAALPGAVSATPGQTPAGYVGACNMLQASGVGAQGGMDNAMSRANQNGIDGMWRAVDVSGCL